MPSNYIPTLNGWRAIAILLVVFDHSLASWAGEAPHAALVGAFGVRVFFALSGFLITSLLLAEEERAGRIALRAFYFRRFFRIMPAASIFLAFVGMLSFVKALDVSPRRLFDTLFFFANYSSAPPAYEVAHFWSLAIEEHFYFMWPGLLVLMASMRRRLSAAIALAILIASWRTLTWKYQITTEDPAKYWGRTDIQVDAIIWGAIVALAVTKDNVGAALNHPLVKVLVLTILPVSAILYIFAEGWKWHYASYQAFIMCMPVLIYQTSRANSPLAHVLELGPMRWLGAISYSLYLWQQLFLTPQQDWTIRTFPLNFAAAAGCAIASYFLIEQPAIRYCRTKLTGKALSRV